MLIVLVLIGIAILALAILGLLRFMEARGSHMVERPIRRPTHLVFAVGSTAVLVTLWVIFDLSKAILPVLIVTQWLPFLSSREPKSLQPRLILIPVVGLIVLLTLGTTVFWLARN